MRHRLLLGWMLVGVCASSVQWARGEQPTTAPATRPASDLVSIRQHLARLASDNFGVRESARIALMGLERSALPTLREAVKQSLPLEPSQAVVLREIVAQVYLTGDKYEIAEGEQGFLGITLPDTMLVEDRGLLTLGRGVAVVSRVPGFCAYRMLQNGDVLLSMTFGATTVEFNRPDDLSTSVRAVRAGQTITFEVLRQGAILRLPITLDPRPAAPDNIGSLQWLREFNNRRADAVEEYWSKDFAPLLGEQLG
jgi:hypothetical protein